MGKAKKKKSSLHPWLSFKGQQAIKFLFPNGGPEWQDGSVIKWQMRYEHGQWPRYVGGQFIGVTTNFEAFCVLNMVAVVELVKRGCGFRVYSSTKTYRIYLPGNKITYVDVGTLSEVIIMACGRLATTRRVKKEQS